MNQDRLIRKFDKQANKYAKRRKRQGADKWRKRLYSKTSGNTLEVAVGAGMNFSYYPKSIKLTAVDFSPMMLEKAREAAGEYGIETHLILSAVEDLDFSPDSFDTIVSTGTICVYDDPIFVLNLFNRWCRADGQILLMEHGVSSFQPLAWLQNGLDPLAVKAIGCHQNRNIGELVEKSSLEIIKMERAFLGYLNLIWARPKKGML